MIIGSEKEYIMNYELTDEWLQGSCIYGSEREWQSQLALAFVEFVNIFKR